MTIFESNQLKFTDIDITFLLHSNIVFEHLKQIIEQFDTKALNIAVFKELLQHDELLRRLLDVASVRPK